MISTVCIVCTQHDAFSEKKMRNKGERKHEYQRPEMHTYTREPKFGGKKNFSFVCLFGLRTLININKRQVSMSIKRRFSRNFYNKELLKVIPCEVVKGKSY